MQTQETRNSFPGLKSYWDFRETGPWAETLTFAKTSETVTKDREKSANSLPARP